MEINSLIVGLVVSVTLLGAMYCEYCGSAVTPINLKVWTFHKYYEVDYNHV